MALTIGALIPAYNAQEHIRETLETVRRQTSVPDYIVVIDNGSPDRTTDIVSTYLVAMLDSDDLWLPHQVECLASASERHPGLVVCFGDKEVFDDTGAVKASFLEDKAVWQHLSDEDSEGLKVFRNSPLLTLLGGNYASPCGCLIRKDAFLVTSGWDPGLTTQGRFAFLPQTVGRKRLRQSSLSHARNRIVLAMNGYRALHKILRLSSELGLTHEEVRSTVGKMREMSSEVLYHASRSGLQDRFSRRHFFYGSLFYGSLLAGAVPAAGFGSPASLKRLGYKSPNEKLNIDAVIVSTPDRMHATAATWSMERRKHLYCQKPLTRTNREARALAKAAAKYKVATQMGNHGYSNDGSRQCAEMFRTNSPYGDGLASERIADLICSFFAADTFSLSREA